jgi:hypothetical protein
MSDDCAQEAVYVPDTACHRVELADDRPREARPCCNDELSRGGRARGDEIEGGFWTGDPWEWLVDFGVGAGL